MASAAAAEEFAAGCGMHTRGHEIKIVVLPLILATETPQGQPRLQVGRVAGARSGPWLRGVDGDLAGLGAAAATGTSPGYLFRFVRAAVG